METTALLFENHSNTGLFEELHLAYAINFPGDEDEDEEASEDNDPPADEEVVHSPVPTQPGKPR